MGIVVWPMVELEADDALASGAHLAAADERVEKVCIWANDKDLAQTVEGDRVVQVDRKKKEIRDAAGVRKKFGVDPPLIPDYLALVGDAQDDDPSWRSNPRLPLVNELVGLFCSAYQGRGQAKVASATKQQTA